MKKTLITLAALAASVASAATYTYTTANFTGSGTGSESVAFKSLELTKALTFDTDWTLDISITIGTENVNQWGSTMIATGLDATAIDYTGGFQLWRSTTGSYLSKTGWSTQGETSATESLTAGETYTFTVQYTATDDVLKLTGPGLTVTKTYADTTADITHLSSAALGHTGWDISVTQTIADTPVTPGGNVPEPTTATLSLLALAGLAARRRRK